MVRAWLCTFEYMLPIVALNYTIVLGYCVLGETSQLHE